MGPFFFLRIDRGSACLTLNKEQAAHLTLRGALGILVSLLVKIHCDGGIRVAEQFLHDLHVLAFTGEESCQRPG